MIFLARARGRAHYGKYSVSALPARVAGDAAVWHTQALPNEFARAVCIDMSKPTQARRGSAATWRALSGAGRTYQPALCFDCDALASWDLPSQAEDQRHARHARSLSEALALGPSSNVIRICLYVEAPDIVCDPQALSAALEASL